MAGVIKFTCVPSGIGATSNDSLLRVLVSPDPTTHDELASLGNWTRFVLYSDSSESASPSGNPATFTVTLEAPSGSKHTFSSVSSSVGKLRSQIWTDLLGPTTVSSTTQPSSQPVLKTPAANSAAVVNAAHAADSNYLNKDGIPEPQPSATVAEQLHKHFPHSLFGFDPSVGPHLSGAVTPEQRRDLARLYGTAGAAAVEPNVLNTLIGTSASPNPFISHLVRQRAIPRASGTINPKLLTKQTLSFSQHLSLLTNVPPLMELVGLILEFDIDTSMLNGFNLISIAPDGNPGLAVVSCKTAYSLSPSFTPTVRDSSVLQNGYFALNDATRFSVQSLSPESAAAKTTAFHNSMWSRLSCKASRDRDTQLGTVPAVPHSVLFRDRKEDVNVPLLPPPKSTLGLGLFDSKRQDALVKKLSTPPDPNSLFAEDLVASYAVDVFASNQWHHLTRRKETYTFPHPAKKVVIASRETGIRTSLSQASDILPGDTDTPPYSLNDAIFVWKDSSLVVSRKEKDRLPNRASDVERTSSPWSGNGYKLETELPEFEEGPNGEDDPSKPFVIPPQRFGNSYIFAMRPVFITGNALPFNPDYATSLGCKGVLRRAEPVLGPRLIDDGNTSWKKEQLNRMVINSKVSTWNGQLSFNPDRSISRRFITPPGQARAVVERYDATGKDLESGATFLPVTHVGGLPPLLGGITGTTEAERESDRKKAPFLPDPACIGALVRFRTIDGAVVCSNSVQFYSSTRRWPHFILHEILLEPAKGDAASIQFHKAESNQSGYLSDDSLVVHCRVPTGQTMVLELSSVLPPGSAATHGVVQYGLDNQIINPEATADIEGGEYPLITPPVYVSMIHAVDEPARTFAFDFTNLQPFPVALECGAGRSGASGQATDKRAYNRAAQTASAQLTPSLTFDPQSTGKVSIDAKWTEWVDDVNVAKPYQRTVTQHVWEQSFEKGGTSTSGGKTNGCSVELPDLSPVTPAPVNHNPGDTRFRSIEYRCIGTSRYAEYFSKTEPRVSPIVKVEMLSSSAPPPPKVLYIKPTFWWDLSGDKVRRKRSNGVRVFLDRPWYASGNAEMLGVIVEDSSQAQDCSVNLLNATGPYLQAGSLPSAFGDSFSLWGADPIWDSTQTANGNVRLLNPSLFKGGLTVNGQRAALAGYSPQFDEDLRLWYCDIPFSNPVYYGVFVRLSLVRYQPNAITGQDLSTCVSTGFSILNPDRIATVNYGKHRLDVVIEGPENPGNSFYITIAEVSNRLSDFSWQDVEELERINDAQGIWHCGGMVHSPFSEKVLVIREYENFQADIPDGDTTQNLPTSRLVYTDALRFV